MVAWAPGTTRTQLLVGAIETSPKTSLDRDLYLHLLGERLRTIVLLSDNPKRAVTELEASLAAAGLWTPMVNVEPETVGSTLIESNPPLWDRLGQILPLAGMKATAPVNLPMARAQLLADRKNPDDRLQAWLLEVSRPR